MKALSLIVASLLVTHLSAGCGGSQKTKNQSSRVSSPGADRSGGPAVKTQRAHGEVRQALLHLQRVHFGFDAATLLPEARVALEDAAQLLQAHPRVHIYIDGHTDQRGTTEYNLALGERRARAVSDYLRRLGIAGERLHIMTFGMEQPWVEGGSAVVHAKNRRAEFRLMRGDVQLVLDDGMLYDDKGRKLETANLSR